MNDNHIIGIKAYHLSGGRQIYSLTVLLNKCSIHCTIAEACSTATRMDCRLNKHGISSDQYPRVGRRGIVLQMYDVWGNGSLVLHFVVLVECYVSSSRSELCQVHAYVCTYLRCTYVVSHELTFVIFWSLISLLGCSLWSTVAILGESLVA